MLEFVTPCPCPPFCTFITSCKIRQDRCQDIRYIDQKTAVNAISVLYYFSDSIRLKSLPFDKRTTATNNRRTIIILLKSTHVIYNKGELYKTNGKNNTEYEPFYTQAKCISTLNKVCYAMLRYINTNT